MPKRYKPAYSKAEIEHYINYGKQIAEQDKFNLPLNTAALRHVEHQSQNKYTHAFVRINK